MKTFTTHIPPLQPPPPPLHKPPPRHHATVDRQPPMRLHNLHRITTTAHLNPIHFHLKNTNHINLNSNFNPNSNFNFISTMSDSDAKKEIKSGDDSIGVKDTKETTTSPEKSPENLPEPPEKPLPGDCCGSGCVRCVWDVYYEELDEYNKLYKSETIGSKVS